MKNGALYILIVTLLSCNGIDQKAQLATQSMVLSGKSGQTAAFNQSFKKALYGYYALKDQFITEDESAIQSMATQLLKEVDSIQIKELNGDTAVMATAQSYIEGITAEIKGLIGEKDLESKRKSLQMIGEQFYDLIRTIQYDQELIYHAYCPMAFNNNGATWLSNSLTIRNPYLPKTMLNCGEVRDSIDFRRKQ